MSIPCLTLVLLFTLGGAKAAARCDYQDFYLIPGPADSGCTRPNVPPVLDVDESSVKVQRENAHRDPNLNKEVIKLPGCFTISFNVRLKEQSSQLPRSFFGKVEYQWWNLDEFSTLKCQNSSNFGCGGFGNNCYYCDVCENLRELDSGGRRKPRVKTRQEIVDQFKGITCPQEPGVYSIEQRFCFNDWSAFDTDGDCKLDFLQNTGEYKSAFQSLQSIGFGTMIARFKLAHNATLSQLERKAKKQKDIESVVDKELIERKDKFDPSVNRNQFATFRDWYKQYRKDLWHKNKYLPWLIYTNEVKCLKVTFDVCDRRPLWDSRRRQYKCPA